MSVSVEIIKKLRDMTGISIGKCKDALEKSSGNIDLAIEFLRKSGIAASLKKSHRSTLEGVITAYENDDCVGLIETRCETDFVSNNKKFHEGIKKGFEIFIFNKLENLKDSKMEDFRSSLVQEFGENVVFERSVTWKKTGENTLATYIHGKGKIGVLIELKGVSDNSYDIAKDIAMQVVAESPEYISKADVPDTVIEKEIEIVKAQIHGKNESIVQRIVEGKLHAFYKEKCLIEQAFIKNEDYLIKDILNKEGLSIVRFIKWSVGE